MENLIRISNLKSRANLLYRFGVRRSNYGKIPDVERWLCNGRYAAKFSDQEDLRDVRNEHLWFFKNSKRFLQPTPLRGSFVSCSPPTDFSRTYCTSSENKDNENKETEKNENDDYDDNDNGNKENKSKLEIQKVRKLREYLLLVKYKTDKNGLPHEKIVMDYNYRIYRNCLSLYRQYHENKTILISDTEERAVFLLENAVKKEFEMDLKDIPDDFFEKKKMDENADYRLPDYYIKWTIYYIFMTIAAIALPILIVRTLKDKIASLLSSDIPVTGYISMQEFFDHLLLTGQVERIAIGQQNFTPLWGNSNVANVYLHPEAVVKGETISNGVFRVPVPDKEDFEQAVRDKEKELGIPIDECVEMTYSYSKNEFIPVGLLLIITVTAIALMALESKRRNFERSKLGAGGYTKAFHKRADKELVGKDRVTFKDVAGLNEAKVEIMEFVDFLKNPEKYKKLGGKMPKGGLLLGPPGCGKTLLAKAIACEAGVPFFGSGGSQFVEVYVGVGATRIRDLFHDARENSPCVIFIDEIDAIGGQRKMNNSEEGRTLNQLLTELDGMGTDKNIICLAATNRAEKLDKALLRPGRFSRHIDIGLPSEKDREDIFLVHLKNLKTLEDDVEDLAIQFSKLTHGMSGADIANMCNEAALHAAREKQDVITRKNLEYASERISLGKEKKKKVLSQEDKQVVAYHESGHALASWLLKRSDDVMKVSIVERTGNSLGVTQFQTKNKNIRTSEDIFEEMCVALGGRAAEMLIFKRLTSGAVQDLEHVTELAYSMVQKFGMNEEVGLVSFPGIGGRWKDSYSQSLKEKIEHEVQKLVAEAYETTQKLLLENEDKLHTLATELMKKETVTPDELVDLIGPPVTNQEQVTTPHFA